MIKNDIEYNDHESDTYKIDCDDIAEMIEEHEYEVKRLSRKICLLSTHFRHDLDSRKT